MGYCVQQAEGRRKQQRAVPLEPFVQSCPQLTVIYLALLGEGICTEAETCGITSPDPLLTFRAPRGLGSDTSFSH
jgi:hypothetical protein